MNINKYLADKGYCTRREGEQLVRQKKVFINGRLAILGDKVTEQDKVEVHGMTQKTYKYLAYHKPQGLATDSPIEGLFYVGRLDKNSSGLLILTNDGRITDRLLNPKREHDKEYLVTTAQKLRPSFKQHMEKGVDIGDTVTKPCKVEVTGEKTFKITLTEGKKHQIRRMCVALHTDVANLKRTRVMNIKLGTLKPGQTRPLTGTELSTFLKNLGL